MPPPVPLTEPLAAHLDVVELWTRIEAAFERLRFGNTLRRRYREEYRDRPIELLLLLNELKPRRRR